MRTFLSRRGRLPDVRYGDSEQSHRWSCFSLGVLAPLAPAGQRQGNAPTSGTWKRIQDMSFETPTATPLSPVPGVPPRRAKYRSRFRKAGSLRLVSHHDLMHCFERMLRRAELPLCTTQGFHPQPRMIFAQSLALGIVGLNEVVELELADVLPAEEVHARLVRQAPPGLEFLSTRSIDFRLGAQVRRAFYRLHVPDSFTGNLVDECTQLLASAEAWVERTRPRVRRFNLRPYLSRLAFRAPFLEMALWVTPNGAARPEEPARLLGLEPVLEQGAYFERTDLELYDELPPDDPERMPACLLERTPAANAPKAEKTRADRLEDSLLHPALSSEEAG